MSSKAHYEEVLPYMFHVKKQVLLGNHNSHCFFFSDLSLIRFNTLISRKPKIHEPKQLCLTETEPSCEQPKAKHLDISEWLKVLDLQRYEDLFKEFSGVEDLLNYTEADIKSLGVKISSHRAKIMTSLTSLRTKYYGELMYFFCRI